MIGERTPGEKLAYADGFKHAILWFESRIQPGFDSSRVFDEVRALHTLMLATLDPPNLSDEP